LTRSVSEPMRIGFRNNFVVRGDQRWLSYLTDTQGGSSGSPVCDDSWSVVALHRGYRYIADGVVQLDGIPVRAENYGVQIAAILEWLESNHTHLYCEIKAGQRQLPSASTSTAKGGDSALI
jgi:endonuclease G